MQIGLIRYRGSSIGGAELYATRLMGALVGAGHEVHLVAEEWAGLPAGVRLHPVVVRGSRAERPERLAQAAAEVVARERFQCVLSLERTACQHVYRAGDGVHRVWLEQRRRFAPWWRRPLIGIGAFHRSVLRLEARTFDPAVTRRVLVNSDLVRGEVERCFGFPSERIDRVRNGIETARFRLGTRDATRQRLGVAPDEYVLLFVGSGWERKGLPQVLSLMRRFEARGDRIRLIVVGKGRAGRTSSNVLFAGTMADIENAYAAADLFVFPPIYEPSSNVVFEALAAGLPVVTTVFNGASEILTPGGNGTVLSDPADLDEMERAILAWKSRPGRISFPLEPIDLARNLRETLAVLERAVAERP